MSKRRSETLEKEVIKKPENTAGRDSDSNVISFNIDNLPESEPQKVDLQSVVEDVSGRDTPINLDQLVIDKNGYVQTVKRELRVSVDHRTGDTIVSVIDGQSRNVVRQIPQNEILAVERLITAPAGMLFRAHA